MGPSGTQNEPTVTPPQHKALQLLEANPRLFAQQGSVVATWRKYGEKKLGPYWRLVYREEGRQRTVYLGRFGTLVRLVRARLRHLQQYRDLRRFINRTVRQTKASLRTVKQDLAMRLRRWGLRLKGWEVRGWRTSTIRWALNLTRPFRCVPLGPQPYFPTITLPNLPEVFGTGRVSDATYWGLLRKEMRGNAKKPK